MWRCGAPQAARDAARKPWEAAVPVARANRQWAPVGTSGSLDDVPHRLRPPSCPAERPRDLYGSILRTFGIRRCSSERGFALATIKTPGLQSAGKWER